tara:strand:- start:330 stop:545 length:216 start_codon:yes stop_codon:yes gene_type:complete
MVVKKNNQETNLINTNISSEKNQEIGKIKTTNVNILLNRVRLDQKKAFKKKIYFSLILITLISSLAIYFIN